MKKIISLIVVITVLMTSFALATESDDYKNGYNAGYNAGYSDGSDNDYKPRVPKLIVVEDNKMPEITAGEDFTLKFTYKNDSEYTAYNTKITPVFENSILEYERATSYETTSSVKKDREGIATFNLKSKASTKKGIYELKFKMEYKNNRDENYSSEGSVFVKVVAEKVKSIVTVDSANTTPERVSAGERFNLKFNINNIGDIDATDMYVRVGGLSQDGFMAVDEKDFYYIGKLSAKSTYIASFDMMASKNITKGNHSFTATVYYKDSNGEQATEEKTLYILDVLSKNESGDETSGKPKIMIASYSTDKANIVAGDTINFTFKFINTSNDKSISNMKITLSSDDGAYMITKGSNTFYVEKLGPKESAARSIELNVKQDLTSKSYPINIDFDYEDSSSNTYVSKEVINLPVTEYSKLVINGANVMDCMMGSQATLSFDYINMGKAKVSNLTASVEGDFKAVQSINYIGNLDAGNSDYYDIMVEPIKEGDANGVLVLAFEDSSGKTIEVRKDFSCYVTPAYVPDDNQGGTDNPYPIDPGGIDTPTEEVKTYTWWQIALYGFGSFIVTFIIVKIITTKIVRKKLEDEI